MSEKDVVESVVGVPAGPEKESWVRFQGLQQQETPKRMEDAAKFLASMISVSLAIFLSVGGKDGLSGASAPVSVLISVVCWFFSLLFSFVVMFPFPYRYAKDSVNDYRRAHGKMVRVKRVFLFVSVGFYFVALLILGVVFLVV